MLFDLANFPYWIALGSGVLLFLLVIASGSGAEDAEMANTDLEADFDTEAGSGADFPEILGWLGVGKAPLILLFAVDLSLWGVIGWLLNITLGSFLGAIPKGLMGGLVLVSSLVMALYLGRLIAHPLEKVFAQFGEDVSSDCLIGCTGIVSSAIIPRVKQGRIGQVDVIDLARNRVSVNAVLPNWATVVPRWGDAVVVIDRQPEYYLVLAQDGPDRETWMSQTRNPKLS